MSKLVPWKQANLPARRGESAAKREVQSLQNDYDRKMARLRQSTGTPEKFVLSCACALHDKPFIAAMERFDSRQPYKVAAIVSVKQSESGAFAGALRVKNIPVEMADTSNWKCLWCGNRDFIVCHDCDAIVCGAKKWREDGLEWFECRDSCGARGSLQPLHEVRGHEGHVRAPAMRDAAPVREQRFTQKTGSGLLLPDKSGLKKLLKR